MTGWRPADLSAVVLNALVDRSGGIEDVIMGCVIQVGEQSNSVDRNAVATSKLQAWSSPRIAMCEGGGLANGTIVEAPT